VSRGNSPAWRRCGGNPETVGAARIALHVICAGQVAHPAALQIKDPDIRSIAIAGRDEGEMRSVGREGGRVVDCGAGDQGLYASAVKTGAEEVRLTRPIALGREQHTVSVRGEARVVLEDRVLQELSLRAPSALAMP
jgi:hypothetical protein